MSKEDIILAKGTVIDTMPGAKFKVNLENDHTLQCIISGKIRKHNIRILLGDVVDVELSPYDLTLGRIVFRHK